MFEANIIAPFEGLLETNGQINTVKIYSPSDGNLTDGNTLELK